MYSRITPDLVSKVFPFTPLVNVKHNLPAILVELGARNCGRDMLVMALATIRAEAESFTPLKEFQSHFNTAPGGAPYSLYDHRADLGNQGPPDGARFCGRGYVQLTGRANYARIGETIGVDLVANPDLACDPHVAAAILVAFLKPGQDRIQAAIQSKDLAKARRLVNGGANGLDRFTDAFHLADALFPQDLA